MTLPKTKAAKDILNHFMENRGLCSQTVSVVEGECYNEYAKLLAMYTSAIRDGVVLCDRNPVAYTIASIELGEFVRMHTMASKNNSRSEERIKEMDMLVDIIRASLAKKLQF